MQRIPHASHWGAYTLLVDAGRIVGVEPAAFDPHPSPIIHAVPHWATSALRIAQPMVREGWLKHRGPSARSADERFVPVDWATALGLVAEELTRVRERHGPAAIFGGSYGWTNCGRFHHAGQQLKRLLSLLGGYTGHVDTYSIAAGPAILRHVLGSADACSGKANTLDDIAAHTETLVVFGAMSPRTAQCEAGGLGRHALQDHLRTLAGRGVHIVLVSPLRDDLPADLPCEWWPIRPNTDAALMLALAGEIVAAGHHHLDFLTRCCSGHEAFLAELATGAGGQPCRADWAAEVCGLPAAPIRALAQRLVHSRSMLSVSWSLQRAHHGELPFWAALGLAAVIGQIGQPGGGVGYGYGSLGGVGGPIPLAVPPALPAIGKPNPEFIPVARITDLLLHPGEPFTYEGASHTYPDIRMVCWAGGNPFHHHQDLNRLRRAWARPDTIVVQDPMWTATARRADIVLPATTSLERNDIAGNRRSAHVLAMHQAIAPIGQSRNDFDILHELADRLGVASRFTEGLDEMGWIRALYERTRRDAAQRCGHAMPDFDAFWAEGQAELPCATHQVHLAGFVADPQAQPLPTATGRILLHSAELSALALSDCPPVPRWLPPAEWLGAADAGDQLHLISHQPEERLHSQLNDAPASLARKRHGHECVRLNPADAAGRGIADGQEVRLHNRRGQCLATARLDDGVRRGVAVLPTGAGYAPQGDGPQALDLAGNPNVLTPDIASSGWGQGCAAHTCLVSVSPWPQPAA